MTTTGQVMTVVYISRLAILYAMDAMDLQLLTVNFELSMLLSMEIYVSVMSPI